MNTATRTVTDHMTGTMDPGVLARGGGRIDLEAARDTPVTITPASTGFGKWIGNRNVSATLDLRVRNVSGGELMCTVGITGDPLVTPSTSSFLLTETGIETVSLSLEAGRAGTTPSGDYDGDVQITCGGILLNVPWWTRIDRGGKP